ncbi:tautomerase family protein [Paenibacillus sp. ACRRX]|uniref:tautomerase family protein n=1 Tax=Paenibacillus sp. ACRRX TaxID=2918206 RepID=UPI001EF5B217|nr:tautomerase family protein [Paenibacillus sp. ACRRX]MCG7409945.1 tautomerase family protein [Paenibacillus sp. ACRRX]
MGQVKVYGIRTQLKPRQAQLSMIIHSCIVDALQYPPDKKFHRFIHLDPEDFSFPSDRSAKYTVIEILMFEGRSVETKKRLISMLYQHITEQLDIEMNDIEITIIESPKHNWGIRGRTGDELELAYPINL